MKQFHLKVFPENSGLRLDAFVVSRIAEISRSQIKKLIEDGFVLVNGARQKPAKAVLSGDKVSVEVPPPKEAAAIPQNISLDVIYEDRDIIVVNKPAGMVVHPAAGHPDGTLVNALLAHCKDLSGIGGELKAGIVHRLDCGTSGCIIAAKNDTAHRSLSAQFKARTVQKIYLALVYGSMRTISGKFDAPIGRSTGDRKKMSGRTKKGRVAHTEWKVIKTLHGLSWLEIKLGTGRMHQIRVHFSEAGHPLVGDPVYGGNRRARELPEGEIKEAVRNFSRPALHAWKLEVDNPRTAKRMRFVAELSDDIKNLLLKISTKVSDT